MPPQAEPNAKNVKLQIEQGSLRLAMILNDNHYFHQQNMPLARLFYFSTKIQKLWIEKDIENIKNLKPADAKKIKQLIKA